MQHDTSQYKDKLNESRDGVLAIVQNTLLSMQESAILKRYGYSSIVFQYMKRVFSLNLSRWVTLCSLFFSLTTFDVWER